MPPSRVRACALTRTRPAMTGIELREAIADDLDAIVAVIPG
jgi:hypothetical protein